MNIREITEYKFMNIREITEKNISFHTSSTSGFTQGFTVTMTVDGSVVGTYKYSNTDEGPYHAVDVGKEFRNQGYGVLLTLKAIETANTYEDIGGYAMDILGHTSDMERVYQSLERNGLVTGALGQLELTDAGEDLLADY